MKKILPFLILIGPLASCSHNGEETALSCTDEKFSTQELRFEKFLGYVDSAMVAQKYMPDHSRKAYLDFLASGQQVVVHVKGNRAIERWIDHKKPSNLDFLRCYQEAFAEANTEDGKQFYLFLNEIEKAGVPNILLKDFYGSLSNELFDRPVYKWFFLYLLMADQKIVMDYPQQQEETVAAPVKDSVSVEKPLEEIPYVEFTPPQVEDEPEEE